MRPWMLYMRAGSAAGPVPATLKPDLKVDPTITVGPAGHVKLGPFKCTASSEYVRCTVGTKHGFSMGADATLSDLNK